MLRDFKPSSFEDIILLIAAYRPGPMQYLPDVIAVKNGKKKATYKHPLLEPILKTTYGATIYQEQVMQIFQSLAGYPTVNYAADTVVSYLQDVGTVKYEMGYASAISVIQK